jgi:hypothetical protein
LKEKRIKGEVDRNVSVIMMDIVEKPPSFKEEQPNNDEEEEADNDLSGVSVGINLSHSLITKKYLMRVT